MKKLLLIATLLATPVFAQMKQSRTKKPELQTNCLTKTYFADTRSIDKKLYKQASTPTKSRTTSRGLGSK